MDSTGVQESDEIYLLAPGGENVKVRDGLMDLKVLCSGNRCLTCVGGLYTSHQEEYHFRNTPVEAALEASFHVQDHAAVGMAVIREPLRVG